MRYTEARLKSLADDMMADLDKETVDFTPNYDETTEEPTVLPTPFPEPAGERLGRHCRRHGDQCAAAQPDRSARRLHLGDREHLPRRPGAGRAKLTRIDKLRQLVRIVTGPDFPTGGFIVGRGGIMQAYTTGRGSILMRAKSSTETNKKGDRLSIVFTEIPVPGQQGEADRTHRRPGSRQDHRRHLRPARRVRSRRHAHRRRAEAR